MTSSTQTVSTTLPASDSASGVRLFARREWLLVGVFIIVILAITALPYVYAYRSAPPDRQFMGVMVNIPDHFQYFSWMRSSRTQVLVPDQMTPEGSAPLLFNLLWWTLGPQGRIR